LSWSGDGVVIGDGDVLGVVAVVVSARGRQRHL
jgi:hypothetical protein